MHGFLSSTSLIHLIFSFAYTFALSYTKSCWYFPPNDNETFALARIFSSIEFDIN